MAVSKSHKGQSDQSQNDIESTRKKPTRFGGAFKKVGRYLQEQAQQNSHSALYLSPRDPVVQKHLNFTEQELLLQQLTATAGNPHALPFGVIPPLSSTETTPRSLSMTTDSIADSSSATGTGILSSMIRHQYASDNILQSYDILIPDRQQPSDTEGYFLIFIHGGYFRDPKQTSKSFNSTISLLEDPSVTSPSITSQITGYASLNYRLAPHPGHPQNPKSTPPYTLNNAFWPDQPNDILLALKNIQAHYPQSHRYILSGHSVGATLSFIATLRASNAGISPPSHILGFCGIYDFPLIHKTNDGYESMTRGAIPPEKFSEASPALYDIGTYVSKWKQQGGKGNTGKRRVMLAHGRSDELVNWQQVESMSKVFSGNEQDTAKLQSDIVEIEGMHYACLENGEVARCFRELLESVSS